VTTTPLVDRTTWMAEAATISYSAKARVTSSWVDLEMIRSSAEMATTMRLASPGTIGFLVVQATMLHRAMMVTT
jgi:hypothetical protein